MEVEIIYSYRNAECFILNETKSFVHDINNNNKGFIKVFWNVLFFWNKHKIIRAPDITVSCRYMLHRGMSSHCKMLKI